MHIEQRIRAMRSELLRDGLAPLLATPSLLAKHRLADWRWDGLVFGVRCVDSPILL